MSIADLLEPTPPNKAWANIYCQSITAESADIANLTFTDVTVNSLTASTLSATTATIPNLLGTVNITSESSSGDPILSIIESNTEAGNVNVALSAYNNSRTAGLTLVTVNDPSPSSNIFSHNMLNIQTLESSPINIIPNGTTTITANQTSTRISTPLSLPGQQYLEMSKSTTQSIPNVTATVVTYDTTVKNVGDIVYNSGVITINTAGTYIISYQIIFASNSDTGIRVSYITVNSSNIYGNLSAANPGGTQGTLFSSSAPVYMSAGSIIVIIVSQGSGGNLNINSTSKLNIARIS